MKLQRRRLVESVRPIRTLVSRGRFRISILRECAVDFVRRRIKNGALRHVTPHSFQNVQRTQRVHFEVAPRIPDRRGHRHLPGHVKHGLRTIIGNQPLDLVRTADIAVVKSAESRPAQPGKIFGRTLPLQVIEHRHLEAFQQSALRQIASEEAATARHEQTHGFAFRVFSNRTTRSSPCCSSTAARQP